MPRNDPGPACATNLVGDGFDFDSSSDEEAPVRKGRISGRQAAESSSDEEESRSNASARRVQGRTGASAQANGRSVRVHSLSGPTRVSLHTASAAASPVELEWKEVSVSYRLSASLRELANGTKKPVLKLSDGAMKIFDNSDGKRSENHICGGVTVTDYDSTFPASLHLDVKGIKSGGSTNSFTQTGGSGALTVRPKASFSDVKGIEIAAGNMEMAQKSKFLHEYKGWNLNNVNNGVTFCADGTNAMIEGDHPIVAYYNAVLEQDGEEPLTEDDLLPGTNMFMAKALDVRECLASLKRTMQENLQIQNLYNVSFELSRAYGKPDDDGNIAWDDSDEIHEGVQGQKTADAILNAPRQFYATVTFKHRTLDE